MSRGRALASNRPIAIRDMRERDVRHVERIEQRVSPIPWPRHMLKAELGSATTVDLVALDGADVAGYLLASRYADVWHVLNVAVDEPYRRRGIAGGLMSALFARTAAPGLLGYTLEVRVSNAGAIALYEKLGFVSRGVRPRYYSDNDEDARIMWREPFGETGAEVAP
ncbi:MAG: ribosomal protein S18-alanine N-acetyltransferase [Thermoleophilia bacterium]|nr:ribosomal protein S18-alanine N-acetyltransferase [Thermoleophilia bacterium]